MSERIQELSEENERIKKNPRNELIYTLENKKRHEIFRNLSKECSKKFDIPIDEFTRINLGHWYGDIQDEVLISKCNEVRTLDMANFRNFFTSS